MVRAGNALETARPPAASSPGRGPQASSALVGPLPDRPFLQGNTPPSHAARGLSSNGKQHSCPGLGRMRPPFPALRRVNRAWTFPSLTLPAKGYKKAASLLQLTACVFCGAPEEIRTPGLQVRSLLLYPAELRARCEDVLIEKRTGCQRFSPVITFF